MNSAPLRWLPSAAQTRFEGDVLHVVRRWAAAWNVQALVAAAHSRIVVHEEDVAKSG